MFLSHFRTCRSCFPVRMRMCRAGLTKTIFVWQAADWTTSPDDLRRYQARWAYNKLMGDVCDKESHGPIFPKHWLADRPAYSLNHQ